jgi:transitional endoplasmic reticulum ATPase
MMTSSISIKLHSAYPRDVGLMRIRLSLTNMKKLGISKGDVVEIIGKKKSVATCYPLHSSEKKKQVARVDSITRFNCGSKENESVTIKKIKTNTAVWIHLEPLIPVPQIDPRYINDCFNGVSFLKSDKIMIPYFDDTLSFKISKTYPDGPVTICNDTTFVMSYWDYSNERKTEQSGWTKQRIDEMEYMQNIAIRRLRTGKL